MADKNSIRTIKDAVVSNRITTMEILDLTDGQTDVTVIMKNKRQVTQPESQAEARQLLQRAKKSPWRDDRLGKEFANKSLQTRKLKNPADELKSFVDSITA